MGALGIGEIARVGYRVFMQSNNPILTRYEKPGQAGFAYQEGQQAYQQASAGTATAAAGAPPTDQAFDVVTAGGGLRVTLADVIVKSAIMFGLAVVFAFVGWNVWESAPWILFVALIAGLGLGLVNALKKNVSPPLMILYAVVQGIMLGSISNWYNAYAQASEYQGIVLQAVIGTMTAFGVMLLLYGTGIVKVNGKFVKVMLVAMVSYLVIGLASLVAAIFGVGGGWGFYGVSGIGLLLCAFGVLLASFSLMLDFEAIKQGIAMGLPERESWRMAFGLLVTLIWLYLELLRFLAIFGGRD